MTRQLDAALIVVAAASGRPARALANRRPAATILALPESDQIARRLSLCWGVIPVVLAERTTAEGALRFGIESAKSRGLVAPGQHAVLLADQVEDRPNLRAVLAERSAESGLDAPQPRRMTPRSLRRDRHGFGPRSFR